MDRILVLLAHNDDEFFVLPLLRHEVASGTRVFIAYMTHGSLYGSDSKVRIEESDRALLAIGVSSECVHQLGLRADIFDGSLAANISKAYAMLLSTFGNMRFDRIITLAWEGGHPDHDACNLIAFKLCVSRQLSSNVFEFPAYNGSALPYPLFRVMDLPRSTGNVVTIKVGIGDAVRTLRSAFFYKSQIRTFLGLLPGAAIKLLIARHQQIREIPLDRDYRVRPHEGSLYYERRFEVTFKQFVGQIEAFISESHTGSKESPRGGQ